jgi:hypothetical protein
MIDVKRMMTMRKYLFLFIFSFHFVPAAMAQQVPALSGGVGIESMHEVMRQQRAYNLKFVFTLHEGDYIAGVAVKIVDAGGRVVLEQNADGPVLLARLPVGSYNATLTYGGVTQSRTLAVHGRGLRTQQARWQRSAADGAPLL